MPIGNGREPDMPIANGREGTRPTFQGAAAGHVQWQGQRMDMVALCPLATDGGGHVPP
jgi:hypothetical protein